MFNYQELLDDDISTQNYLDFWRELAVNIVDKLQFFCFEN